MNWNIPKTWIPGAVLSGIDLNAQVRDNLNFLKTKIALEDAEELTIADGVIEKTQAHHMVDTEADAGTDDLISINGGNEGDIILLRPAGPTRAIVLKHGASNIWNPALVDIALNGPGAYAMLIFDGVNWCVLGGPGGGGGLVGVFTIDGGAVVDPNNAVLSFDLNTFLDLGGA